MPHSVINHIAVNEQCINSTGALEFGLEKKCRKLIFSGYISDLPVIGNLMSPQKSPLRGLHNLHIN